MARPTTPTLTEVERKLLEVLWKKKEATVRDVADELAKRDPIAYTTVQTMLGVLARKGLVRHRTEGRAFIYSAVISRKEALSNALDHLLKQFFNGSPKVLAQHLISDRDITAPELESLRRLVDAAPDKE